MHSLKVTKITTINLLGEKVQITSRLSKFKFFAPRVLFSREAFNIDVPSFFSPYVRKGLRNGTFK